MKDIDTVLTVEPLAIGDEATMIVNGTDKIQLSNQWKVCFAHNVDLPKRVGMRRFEPFNPFNRRQGDAVQMIADQDPSDSLPVDCELQIILDEASRTVFPLELRGDDSFFDFLGDQSVIASPSIDQTMGAF